VSIEGHSRFTAEFISRELPVQADRMHCRVAVLNWQLRALEQV